MKIRLTANTLLKVLPIAQSVLAGNGLKDQMIELGKDTALDILTQIPFDGAGEEGDHVLIQLAKPLLNGQRCLFVEADAAKIEGTEPDNNPKDTPADPPRDPSPDYGPTIELPGISRPVGIYEPVYFEPARCNFTWSELTKGGSRIPVNPTITQRLVRLAKYMDGVRSHLGDRRIHITSGYRDPVSNRRVGGARISRHMAGDAVDFWVEGIPVVEVFKDLKSYHSFGGLAVGNGFVHLDLRPGSPARWTYPGGPRVELW